MNLSPDILWHHATVTRGHREAQNGHHGAIIWFTGLSGSGKSTLAHAVEEVLHQKGCRTFVLDGDNVRHGLCGDLGFSCDARTENIRRVGEMAKLFMEAGIIVLTAFISPYRTDRDLVRGMVKEGDFIEIYCNTSIEVCEHRDVKGLYKKARAGQVAEFTGISSSYEAPVAPEIALNTGVAELDACVLRLSVKQRSVYYIRPIKAHLNLDNQVRLTPSQHIIAVSRDRFDYTEWRTHSQSQPSVEKFASAANKIAEQLNTESNTKG